MGIKDCFGNTITFKHTQANGYWLITEITDTAGRVVNISYSTSAVVVSLPGNQTVTYALSPVAGQSDKYTLSSITDQAGRVAQFTYSVQNGYDNYWSKSAGGATKPYANLTQAAYPTGASSSYQYETAIGNLGSSGLSQSFRLASRHDETGLQTYNQVAYTYTGSYTGYGSYNDPNNLPSGFTYMTAIASGDGMATEYTFNNKHLPEDITIKTSGGVKLQSSAYEYNADKLPTRTRARTYGPTGVSYTETEELFAYNGYGDPTQQIRPQPHAAASVLTSQTVNFSSSFQTQSQTITLPSNLVTVLSASVNNGQASWSQNGSQLTVSVTDGYASSSSATQSKTAAATLTNTCTAIYNAQGAHVSTAYSMGHNEHQTVLYSDSQRHF